MPRPIDADLLKNDLMDLPGGYSQSFAGKACLTKIDDAPTLDYVPVKRGKWIPWIEEVEIYNTGGFTERKQVGWLCSECKNGRLPMHRRFCPDCGAKMGD